MTTRDGMNGIHPLNALSPVSVADDTAEVGNIIDTRGHDSATFVILTGALADIDATFAVLVEDGDDSGLSDAAAVADADLVGTEALAGFTFALDDGSRKIGYVGPKRYVRITITPTNNASGALLAAACILGHAHLTPTANPPV